MFYGVVFSVLGLCEPTCIWNFMTPPSPSRPINDTVLQRARVYLVRHLLKPWAHCPAPRVFLLPFDLVLKFGRHVSLSEAQTLQYLSKHTSLPVPRVITAFESSSGRKYILMSRVPGVPLSRIFHSLTTEQQRNILHQLQNYINELRTLPPPKPQFVGAVDFGPLHDERVHDGPFGPFETVAEFHKALRGDLEENSGHAELDRMIEEVNSRDYSCRLTHGDLAFRNIITRDGQITGIVDWETAGWYPDYWEYASIFYSFFDAEDLKLRVEEFLCPYPEKRKTEQKRRQLFNMM